MSQSSKPISDSFDTSVRGRVGRPPSAKVQSDDENIRLSAEAQKERLRLLAAGGQADLKTADDAPPLPRRGRHGENQFSAAGMREAIIGRVTKDAAVNARYDAAFMLAHAYRPGAEGVALSTWVRVIDRKENDFDVSPLFSIGNVYRPEEVALVRLGYTDVRLRTRDGRDEGQQAVMTVAPVSIKDGVAVATTAQVYDLTDRHRLPISNIPRTGLDGRLNLIACAAYYAYSYVDTIRRFANPEEAWYGVRARAGNGPLVMTAVYGHERTPDGVPVDGTYVAWTLMNGQPDEAVRSGDDELMLSFAHLGPVAFDRGLPPTVGVAPWSVLPGNVYDYDDVVLGDVTVAAPV